MAQFTTRKVIGGGVRVSGTDNDGNTGSTVLFSTAWEAWQDYKQALAENTAKAEAAAEFFAPLRDKLKAARAEDKKDWTVLVIEEGREGVPAETVKLDREGTILRILDETDGDNLYWVDNVLVALED